MTSAHCTRVLGKPHTMEHIRGLTYIDNFVSEEEEGALLAHVDASAWDTRLRRRTQHYGYMYDYSGSGVAKRTHPIPEWAQFVVKRLAERGVLASVPDQMIVNEYMPGQGIAPHVDDPTLFADGIVSLSLGSRVDMSFSVLHSYPTVEIPLQPRSIVVLHDRARYMWRHSIEPRVHDGDSIRGRRVSLTFRTMLAAAPTRVVSDVKYDSE